MPSVSAGRGAAETVKAVRRVRRVGMSWMLLVMYVHELCDLVGKEAHLDHFDGGV
jgi:hypothetical protein